MSQPKKKNQTWILFLVIVVILLLAAKPLMYLIGDSLIVSDDVEKADLIAAVSGPEYRIKYAAELYRRGLGDTLFYTGGFSENNQRIEADWSEYLATTEGVPPEAIATDGSTVLSTYQEAERLKAYIDAHPEKNIQSIIIVTDPYHTRRARWAYQKVMGSEIKVQMAMVPFDRTGYTKQWWRSEVSRKMVMTEYFKSGFYILRYQIATGPFQKFLAQFDKF